MRHFWSLASKCVMGPAPLLAAMRFFQLVSTLAPRGVTNPRPVTTTRRMFSTPSSLQNKRPPDRFGKPFIASVRLLAAGQRTRSALVLVDILDRVANSGNLLRGIVRDFDPELFLESHYQLDAEMFDDDLLYPIGSLAHETLPPFVLLRCPSEALGKRQVAAAQWEER